MKTKIDADKVLDELMKASSSCIEVFGEKEELDEMSVNDVKNELEMASKKIDLSDSKVYTFSNSQKKEISNEVVIDHPECLLNVNMIDTYSRNDKNEVEIDLKFQYLDEMMKYVANEYDINELNGIEFVAFCRELIEMRVPFKMDIMNRIYNGSNEYGAGWKNRCLIVNGNEYKLISKYMNTILKLSDIKYNDKDERLDFVIDCKYEPIIQSFSKFIEDENSDYNTLIENVDRRRVNEFVNEGLIDMNNKDVRSFFNPLYSPFLRNTILFGQEYDSYLREWLGSDYKWRLLYRASEHDHTGRSFHEYCDDIKGPTLVIIKSSGGWIFGGYTTQSWKIVHPDEDGCIL